MGRERDGEGERTERGGDETPPLHAPIHISGYAARNDQLWGRVVKGQGRTRRGEGTIHDPPLGPVGFRAYSMLESSVTW